MQELVSRLNGLCDDQPFRTHFYFKNLRTGEEASRDGDTVVYSASTRKVSIMMALLNEIHEGRLSLDDPFTIDKEYQKPQSGGCFQWFKPGSKVTLGDAVVMMIIVSDNTCTGKIVDMLGTDKLNEYCGSIGMVGTTHRQNIPDPNLPSDEYWKRSNATTANDQGHLLELIVAGAQDADAAAELGCTPELCQYGLDVMTWQKLGKLYQMLPYETKVASKSGRGNAQHSDIGVIYHNDEPLFIMTTYTDDVAVDYPEGSGRYVASTHIARLAKTCWDESISETSQ
jgi:beta-lactamase class A